MGRSERILAKNIVIIYIYMIYPEGEDFIAVNRWLCKYFVRKVSSMSNAASTAIEELRKNLYAAAKNAAYNYQCKEVQQINAQLDKLICRFMKKQTGKIR